ncbi:hypothetical protein ACQCVK_17710 [Rossellomorea vietnamensis]|uniref:hypothetical protein n=1 Tax=Rossellomorea vietnamensis TaxID=218284 RepID=UPI003CEC8041
MSKTFLETRTFLKKAPSGLKGPLRDQYPSGLSVQEVSKAFLETHTFLKKAPSGLKGPLRDQYPSGLSVQEVSKAFLETHTFLKKAPSGLKGPLRDPYPPDLIIQVVSRRITIHLEQKSINFKAATNLAENSLKKINTKSRNQRFNDEFGC